MLALHFPWLPAERLRITRPHLAAASPDAPVAFTEAVRGALRLAAVDEAAAALGLTQAMTMADARARVPELRLHEQDIHADLAWLERLADGCARYTPVVALDPPDGLILETTGCDHLLGGEAALAEDIEMRLARLGVTVRLAFAATPEAARALARFSGPPAPDERAAILRLPVAALELDEEATTGLRRAGLKTVGDVARRPLAGIAARFGTEVVTTIRRMLGEEESPLAPRRVAPPPEVERRFAEPIARTETALAILGELAAEAAERLEEQKLGGRRFEALLFRSDGLVRSLRVETGQPSRDVPALLRLFRERIDGLADPIDPGFGFDLIRLRVPLAEPLGASQLKLEGGAVAETQVAALVDRLSTRLGRGRVRRFAPRDTHIPEQAELLLPALEAEQPTLWGEPEPGEPPLRPIHLFDPPQPIEVLGVEVPDGPPHRFRWRRELHEVARFEGPERIAPEWWRRRGGVAAGAPSPARPAHQPERPPCTSPAVERRPLPFGECTAPAISGDVAAALSRPAGAAPAPAPAPSPAPRRGPLTRDYWRVEDKRGRRFWIFRHGFFEPEQPMPHWYVHGVFA